MKHLTILGIPVIAANFCPDCGQHIRPHIIHVCGQFDFTLLEYTDDDGTADVGYSPTKTSWEEPRAR